MPDAVLSRLALVADLMIEVGDERGSTTARLTNDDDGLVLEVPEPATLLRCVPGRGLTRDLPVSLPLDRLADIPVRLTSRGRDLGRVHLTSTGTVRLRPSLSGVPTVVHTALTYPPTRAAAAVLASGALAAAVYLLRRRR
jgi:hypothetical protein